MKCVTIILESDCYSAWQDALIFNLRKNSINVKIIYVPRGSSYQTASMLAVFVKRLVNKFLNIRDPFEVLRPPLELDVIYLSENRPVIDDGSVFLDLRLNASGTYFDDVPHLKLCLPFSNQTVISDLSNSIQVSSLVYLSPGSEKIIYKSISAKSKYASYISDARSCWAWADRMPAVLLNYVFKQSLPCKIDSVLMQRNRSGLLRIWCDYLIKLGLMLWMKIIFDDLWEIGVSKKTEVVNESFTSKNFILIKNPHDGYLADPFLFSNDKKQYLFYETYSSSEKKGKIACAELNDNGDLGRSSVVLEEPYHLSFPFVFEFEQRHWMLVESKHAQGLRLYECLDFPKEWRFHSTLLDDVAALDTVLFFHNNSYWLITTQADPVSGVAEDVYFYYSDNPFGPWKQHCQSPAISDIRFCRSAGKPFYRLGKLTWPSQNCAERYGHSLGFVEFELLDQNKIIISNFSASKLVTSWRHWGNHTWNTSSKFIVTDFAIKQPRFVRRLLSITNNFFS